jgi:inorganic pyrophosphatase
MNTTKLRPGDNIPEEINVVIEITPETSPVKYEFDKESGFLVVDRVVQTPMYYPCNYGFIPNTLADDGDPTDVLVINNCPLIPGCMIKARPIAVLVMEDEAGMDEKILAVPTSKVNRLYDKINKLEDLPQSFIDQIKHFFERYKDLEKAKWVKVKGWESKEKAFEIIMSSVKNYK